MSKLSQLSGLLRAQGTALAKIQTDVQALKNAGTSDPDLPADAEEALAANDAAIKAVDAILNPVPPQP